MLPPEYRENFIEALENVQQAFTDFRVRQDNENDEVQNLLILINDERATSPKGTFWTLVAALKRFIEQNPQRQPPMARLFPDMKCTTSTYVRMKKDIFGKKCDQDFELMKSYAPEVDDESIRLFIDNVLNLKTVEFRPYH
jgi:hypothetical protein